MCQGYQCTSEMVAVGHQGVKHTDGQQPEFDLFY